MSPKVIVISLDGATDSIVDKYLANGVLDAKTGLGLLKSKGVAATDNETITPSLTAPSHIAIATGSTAVNNDINANSFHLIANPFTTNTSGFAAPIGGYTYQSGIDPSESAHPTANPIWLSLQAAGKKVVAATFPGADGATIRSATGIVLDKKEDRTVSYTVPFGAFGGQGARGFNLTATDFGAAAQTTLDQLRAIGKTSFSPVLQTKTAIESFTIGGVKFDFQVAALDTTNDSKVNYDSVVIFDATQGIKAAPATLPSTGSAFLKAGDTASQPFYLEGTPDKVGTGFYLANLASDLTTVRIARYAANNIPRPADNPGVVANVDDINNNIGFWKPQPDFRIPERISPGFGPFTDPELEAIYADQVKSFVDYQTNVAVRAIQQNTNSDLVLTYIEQPDGAQHQFLITDPRQATDFTNPNSIGAGQDTAKIARYQKYIENAYQTANSAVQKIIDTVGVDANGKPNSNIIVVSDHGFAPFHTAVSMNNLLRNAGFDSNKVRAVTSGSAVNVYINLKGREPNGVVEIAEYLTLQKQVLDTLKGFADTNANYVTGAASNPIFDKVYNRVVPATATTANDVINARGEFIGEDTGDVFALLKTGYNFDGTQATPVIRKGDMTSATPVLSVPNFYGAHGYDPTLPEMKSIFYAAGPDIDQKQLGSVRNIDVAPTIEKILGVNPADTVDGRALELGSSTAIIPTGNTVVSTSFVEQKTFPTGLIPTGAAGQVNGVAAPLGGLSGITYDAANKLYYAISDDRSQFAPARFYSLTLDPNNLAAGVNFTGVTVLKDASGNAFALNSLDPEGIAFSGNGTVFVSSEGEANPGAGRVSNPFIKEFSLTTGQEVRSLTVPTKFLPVVPDTNGDGKVSTGDIQTAGVRNNLAFESLTISPDKKTLFTATENALFQDGDRTSTTAGSRVRIVQYNLSSGKPEREFLYNADPIAKAPNPSTGASDSGLVDLLAIDNRGTFLALERSFAVGQGNTIKIYEVTTQGATDISSIESLNSFSPAQLQAITPVTKRLLLDLDTLKLPNSDGNHPTGTDNIEGLTFGPKLPDGRQSIVLVSDNNFNATQFTQVIALSADLVPTATPLIETNPPLVDDETKPFSQRADADDPAVYVNATDAAKSLVLTSVKNGGLRVYDLTGNLVQTINPSNPDVRYNNVDLQYGFSLGGQKIDIAVASDRNNDKLAIFKINPDGAGGNFLQNITDANAAQIFQAAPFAGSFSASAKSAYGLGLYRSPITNDYYAFTSRRQTGDIAQLKLVDKGNGSIASLAPSAIGYELVRNFTIPSSTTAGATPQTEGIVVDQETGFLYIGQEDVGIWKFNAEPGSSNTGTLIEKVKAEGGKNLTNDVEGLTIYYGKNGTGYLLASSQGDNTFAAYTREGNNAFVGRFGIGANGLIDSVQESDGAEVINVPLGPNFPNGLFVTQDGSNQPAITVAGENISSNFKLVPFENIVNSFATPLTIDTTSYNPRNPVVQPKLTNYDFTNLPKLGTASNGQEILLGGFSGLYFQGLAANGNLKFVTHTDRGPNGEPTGANRPFLLPNFQPEIISFELNRQTGKIDITKRTGLFRADGTTPLTGLPNLQAQANGLAYTDEVGVDLAGKVLPNDPLGADLEGIVVAANGDYWMVDEYRPAIYHFDIKGKLLDRFIPQGTATAPEPDQAAGTFGKEVLPAVYAQRRSNRGFEAVALDGDKLYAFIQSPIDNPDNAGDTASRASRNLRILEFNTVSKTVTGEYVYLLDNITGSGNARTDKLGDAVALGNGKFALVERDDLATSASNKLIYQIDLAGATNINNPANFTLPAGKTIEQLTPAELTTAKITPVSKSLIANAAQLGYTGVEKLEGLALVAPNTLALINDNDFNVAGGTVPERLGILELAKDLPVAKPAFPNGIASGDTTQNSTVLWTRANALGKVTFEYSTKADFSSIAGTKTATVTDALLPVKVNVDGLTANTDYFYRVTDANGAKVSGKFSTAAALGSRTGLKFGASGDWRGELAPYPAVSNADTANLKFFVELGDTIYGDEASPAVRNPDGSEKSQATTLAEYRAKHAEVYGSSYGQNTLGDLRANTSILATIDDHEVTNDFSGGRDLATSNAATQTLFGAKTGLVNDSPLFDNGLQAFQEYNPLQDLTYSTPGDARTDGERKLYRANTFGSDAATFILDTRSFRDTELANVTNLADQAQVGKFLTDSFDPKRTLLGKQQLADLKRDLLQAEKDGVTWKFITVPEPIQNIGVLAASDRFEGYAAERTEILKFINDNKISNVVFVAADIHGTLVNNLTYQTAPGQAQIATSAFEITTGSVAYSQPFGQTIAQLGATLGVIPAAQKALYDSLPTAGKDAFIKGVVDNGLSPLGYDPLGLDKNLTQANGLINAKLLQGDYVATHVYGWTEFNIDKKTQKLTVTTYGIDPYTRAELEANPSAIISRQPQVVSQFEVLPNNLEPQKVVGTTGADKLEAGITPGFDGYNNVVFTGAGNDTVDIPTGGTDSGNNRIDTGSGNDVIFIADADRVTGGTGNDEFEASDAKDYRASGGAGNDTFYLGTNGRALGGEGNDKFFVGAGGGNLLTGGAGVDQFWIANGDLPATANSILDFQVGTDVIGIQGIGANASNIVLTQVGADASIGFSGQTLALLKGIQASSLTPSNLGQFVFA